MQRIPETVGMPARLVLDNNAGAQEAPQQVTTVVQQGHGARDVTRALTRPVTLSSGAAMPAATGVAPDRFARFGPPALARAGRARTPAQIVMHRLEQWAREGPAREAVGRQTAVARILKAMDNRVPYLNLDSLGLSTLPPCLAGIEGLQYLRASHNRLTELPTLQRGLLHLLVDDNCLTRLPVLLPPGLEALDASANQLEVLPRLPPSLKSLQVAQNRLTFLPPLPEGLTELAVGGNPAPCLPATLPAGLRRDA